MRTPKSTVYLTLEQLITIHDDQIERYGGSHGVRDLSPLESAIMRPQTTFSGEDMYPSVFDKAAALTHSVVMNHAFVDGNKRTGFVSAAVFLELNRYRLGVGQNDLINATLKIAKEKWNIKKLSIWLKENSKKI